MVHVGIMQVVAINIQFHGSGLIQNAVLYPLVENTSPRSAAQETDNKMADSKIFLGWNRMDGAEISGLTSWVGTRIIEEVKN